VVKALFVDGEDHHLRSAEDARAVERADLDEHRARQAGCLGQQMRSAFRTELARDWVLQVFAFERLGLALGVREAGVGHAHDDVGMPARDVLALAAVALPLEQWVSLGLVAHRAAITAAFELHRNPPLLCNAERGSHPAPTIDTKLTQRPGAPPRLCVRPSLGLEICRAPASPRSCSHISYIMRSPLAPIG